MKLSHSVSGALRTFAYFMTSGSHYMLNGVDYVELCVDEPSLVEQVYAILINTLELDEKGDVINFKHAQKRATDYIRWYVDHSYVIDPPYEDLETELHCMPTN
ncbi:DUF7677 family protein [Providencia vermicola]|uniref:DUF7677 family protein n=1 Tax=Providencia vermicola TaxID=333965 RepID=UPI0032D9B2AB